MTTSFQDYQASHQLQYIVDYMFLVQGVISYGTHPAEQNLSNSQTHHNGNDVRCLERPV
jgi:hypothetical protein